MAAVANVLLVGALFLLAVPSASFHAASAGEAESVIQDHEARQADAAALQGNLFGALLLALGLLGTSGLGVATLFFYKRAAQKFREGR